MSTSFPGALDALTNPAATDGLTGHAAQHANANDAIEALEAKVGVDNSTDPASLDYRVATLESGGGGGIWGSITGALSDQTDLQAALNGKLSASATTDAIAEGSSNLYFTAARVRDAVLTGLSTATNAVIAATDSVLTAFGKLQAQISGHTSSTANPHSVTKTQVGLGNVDNTSDLNKPVSTAQAAADVSTLNAAKADATTKANAAQAAAIAASTPIAHVGAGGAAHANAVAAGAAGFMTGEDKTKLDGIAPGANNYTHPTGDGNLHVPATGTTNNGKVLKAGATAGSLSWETMAKADVGLANVDNTSDANKPVSTAQQIALDGKVDEVNPSTSETFTHSGDVVLSGSGKRITGDFSNATIANRLMFQTSTPNSSTGVGAIPSGSGSTSFFAAYGGPDLNNTHFLYMVSDPTRTFLESGVTGAGVAKPLIVYVGGAERLRIDTSGNVLVTSPTGLGYGPGAGGTVIQATSKSTAVTLNKPCGLIITAGEALAHNAVAFFAINCSLISTYDGVIITPVGPNTGVAYNYQYGVVTGNMGLFYISIRNVSGVTLTESISLVFSIIKEATN